MNHQVLFRDLGRMDYRSAWDLQETHFNAILEQKKQNQNHPGTSPDSTPNYLFFVEHPPVYTLGKSGDQNNLLISTLELQKIQAEYVETNRGGDITFHGPGQIVAYPILDLENFSIGLKTYIDKLEEVVIKTLLDYGISSSRLDHATGVWLDAGIPGKERKICAIGVRTSKFVTMHGFAFNINTQLDYFNSIHPCGFTNKGVTSLKKELGKTIDVEEVKTKLKTHFQQEFSMILMEQP